MERQEAIFKLIDQSLEEDIGKGDITTLALVPDTATTTGIFVAKQAGVIAGLPFLSYIFQKIDPRIEVTLLVNEGSYQKTGTEIASVIGPAGGILTGERVALNLIEHASGIATTTSNFVRKLKGLPCQIFDTRRTRPGLRCLERYAVCVGNGMSHRDRLDDRFVIKINHIRLLAKKSQHPILDAVKKVTAINPHLPIEIEVESEKHLKEALQTDAELIVLVKMNPEQVKKAVRMAAPFRKKICVHPAGALTPDIIRVYAETGVDAISIGLLASSSSWLDIGMRFLN